MFENFDFLWKISIFGQKFRFSTKNFDHRPNISIFDKKIQSSTKNFDLWPNILISTRILWNCNFSPKFHWTDQNFNYRPKLRVDQNWNFKQFKFSTQISMDDQNFDGRSKFRFFLTKISIFGKKIVKFSTEIPTFENCNYRN